MSDGVLLVSPAPDAGGVGQYADQLAGELNDTIANRLFLDRDGGPKQFVVQAVKTGRTDASVVHIQHVYGLFGSKSIYMWLFFPLVWTLLRLRGRSLVLTVHEVWTEQTVASPLRSLKLGYIRVVNWALGRVATTVVFLSESAASEFSPAPQNTAVVPHGVDLGTPDIDQPDARDRFGYEPEDVVVAQLGYINRRKGPDVFVELAQESEQWEFLLAGGPRKAELEPFYRELLGTAPANVTATGHLEAEAFHAAFSAADVVVLPYRTITQSGIFNWCAAYGLPVVASDIPYFSELAHEFDCVELFPVEDVEQASERLSTVISETHRREELETNISQYASQHSLESVASEYRAIYEGVRK